MGLKPTTFYGLTWKSGGGRRPIVFKIGGEEYCCNEHLVRNPENTPIFLNPPLNLNCCAGECQLKCWISTVWTSFALRFDVIKQTQATKRNKWGSHVAQI